MTGHGPVAETTRTVRFHEFGEPGDVLRLEETTVPAPGPGRIRVRVHACGLNPADWALARGLFPGKLPRGIGVDVAGRVDAVGDGVGGVAVGELVFGTADWRDEPSAGAADVAIMDRWTPVPEGLGLEQAAALPMVLETAYRSLVQLGCSAGDTVLIHGAGSMVGYAAVQIALIRGVTVIATAGETYAEALRAMGATVTGYGDGMVERITELHDGSVDWALDTAPVDGALPDLVAVAGGDPKRVLTISHFQTAKELGVRDSFSAADQDADQRFAAVTDIAKAAADSLRFDIFPEFGQLAAEGRFTIPVARVFALEDWRTALELSLSGNPHGKLLLLPDESAAIGGNAGREAG